MAGENARDRDTHILNLRKRVDSAYRRVLSLAIAALAALTPYVLIIVVGVVVADWLFPSGSERGTFFWLIGFVAATAAGAISTAIWRGRNLSEEWFRQTEDELNALLKELEEEKEKIRSLDKRAEEIFSHDGELKEEIRKLRKDVNKQSGARDTRK